LNKKLHILFLCSWYPNRVLPNNGDFIQRHAEAVALKHKVTAIHIISDKNNYKTIEIADKNINGVRTIVAYLKPCKNTILKTYKYFLAYYKILNKVEPYDLVHLNVIYPAGLMALYLKWFKKKPYIISEHWHGYHKPFCNSIGLAQKILLKLCAKKADVICPVTNNLGDAMQNFGLKGRYYKVSNVVNTDLFKPLENENDTFEIIHISSMDKVKNVPKILEVISQLQKSVSNFNFTLLGSNATEFKPLAKSLKINEGNITFTNQIPQSKLLPYLQKADVFVLFSDIESSSVVLLETFACGIPVIATNVGGVSEHFPKNFGALIPKGDSTALLKTLIAYSKKTQKFDKKAMYHYIDQNFSPISITKQFTEVYLSALKH